MSRKSSYGGGISSTLKDSLGVGKDNFPQTVLTPPPKYPPLSGRPCPLVLSTDQEYMLAIGKELFRSLRAFNPKDILMEHLPSELGRKRVSAAGGTRSSSKRTKKSRLSLEALESLEDKDEPEEGKKSAEQEEEDEEEAVSGDDVDEELDEGTDYANNYFDNGEDYGDNEEDNLDEGGIY